MAKRGPAPTPTGLLKLRGSWRAGIRGEEVEYPTGAPTCPRVLPPEGKKEWRRVVRLLAEAKVLQVADLAVLASYCRTWAEWTELTERSADWSYGSESDRKEARLLADCERRLQRLAAEFGFTPSSRTRIHPGEGNSGVSEGAIIWK